MDLANLEIGHCENCIQLATQQVSSGIYVIYTALWLKAPGSRHLLLRGVASACIMVHLRSLAAREARLGRAMERGFVRPSAKPCKDIRLNEDSYESDIILPPPPLPPLPSVGKCGDDSTALQPSLDNALALIQIQNDTIAQLQSQIEQLQFQGTYSAWSGGVNGNSDFQDAARLEKLKADVEMEKRFYSLLPPHLGDLLRLVQEDTASQIKSFS